MSYKMISDEKIIFWVPKDLAKAIRELARELYEGNVSMTVRMLIQAGLRAQKTEASTVNGDDDELGRTQKTGVRECTR